MAKIDIARMKVGIDFDVNRNDLTELKKELSILIDYTEIVINLMYNQGEETEMERLKLRDLQNEAKYYSVALKGLIEYGPY